MVSNALRVRIGKLLVGSSMDGMLAMKRRWVLYLDDFGPCPTAHCCSHVQPLGC